MDLVPRMVAALTKGFSLSSDQRRELCQTGYLALCRAAETEMTGRLRDGVSPEDCGPAFVLGCAWLALSGLAGGQYGGVSAFTAGSVTLREEDLAGAVELLLSDALSLEPLVHTRRALAWSVSTRRSGHRVSRPSPGAEKPMGSSRLA